MIDIRQVPEEQWLGETEVLVCGSGPAGVGAALCAAREGAKVTVLEMGGCLGGIATAGMMSHWGGRSSSKILPELLERTRQMDPDHGWVETNRASGKAVYHDWQMIALEEMFREAGVQVWYYTMAVDAVLDGRRVVGVKLQSKSTCGYVRAKCVVDATGDGDVAAAAGVPFTLGRETDGRMQPCTLMFKIGGVDYDTAVFPGSFESRVETPKGELQALAKKLLPFPAGHVLLYRQPQPGTVCVNMTNAIEIDGTDPADRTRALMTCRAQIGPILRFLREYAPGYENCWLMSTGSLLGVRETRHFQGRQSLSAQDMLEARVYEDWVVRRGHFNFDVHNLTGASLDVTGVQKKWTQSGDYTVPYGCLLPREIEGLLLSGRNVSGSHLAHSNFRIMSVCMAIGEAAGVAAALSVRQDLPLSQLDVTQIQQRVGE